MTEKPDKIIKRIIKAVGQRQSVLVIGQWNEELIKGIRENQNSLTQAEDTLSKFPFEDNSATRIIADYSSPIFDNNQPFFNEVRKLLLPTGMIIISANCEKGIFEKLMNRFNRNSIKEEEYVRKIKPKILQDQIHDNGFLIDGYYGYPEGHLLMMAQIHNKEVTTLFSSNRQETVVK